MGTTRHKYYIQEEGIGMHSLPGKNGTAMRSGKYDVTVTTTSQLGAGVSEEDFENKSRGDADSAEDILPMQGRADMGITKTVNVTIS
jgi:hypothetical protein